MQNGTVSPWIYIEAALRLAAVKNLPIQAKSAMSLAMSFWSSRPHMSKSYYMSGKPIFTACNFIFSCFHEFVLL